MTSIRTRLLLSLLLALALAAGLVGAVTYRSALGEAESLFDYQLRQMALSLRDQGEIAPGEAAALQDEDLDFVIQIWSIDGRSVYASRAHRNLPLQTVLGLAEATVDGERWRTFGVAARGRVIQVAQPVRIRQRLAADAALHSVLPLAATAPLLAALMWWLITRSLRPLSRVAAEVRERDVATLAPLPQAGLPEEVAPLVQSLNALLARLGEAMAGQRAFVADAAHELRSPLTALKLQAQMVKRAPDETTRADATQALVAGVDRAAHLVEQLLSLARQEPGAHAAGFEPVPLAVLLRQVLADAAPLAQGRQIGLSLEADEALQVSGDPAALAVLARNLVDNALRYTPSGGQVQVSCQPQDAGAAIRVDDSGPGIAPADRERVFDRFVRGAAAGETPGSGLGLAIVRSIAQRHAASVGLSTSPLGGLRVEVLIPSRV
ncbi:MAG: sensor histidine kinase N-terminal domain-containing protein [Ideonella sp.]|nr:sensor histidine kinase N-terminal domain-containing protein [Ideonella sp.]MBL0149485.1 sensor histidine kinase N-terminal domain-containing protein [Ideonella sp.]